MNNNIKLSILLIGLLALVSCAPTTQSYWYKNNTNATIINSAINLCNSKAQVAVGVFRVPKELNLTATEYRRLNPNGNYGTYQLGNIGKIYSHRLAHDRAVENAATLCMYELGYRIETVEIQ